MRGRHSLLLGLVSTIAILPTPGEAAPVVAAASCVTTPTGVLSTTSEAKPDLCTSGFTCPAGPFSQASSSLCTTTSGPAINFTGWVQVSMQCSGAACNDKNASWVEIRLRGRDDVWACGLFQCVQTTTHVFVSRNYAAGQWEYVGPLKDPVSGVAQSHSIVLEAGTGIERVMFARWDGTAMQTNPIWNEFSLTYFNDHVTPTQRIRSSSCVTGAPNILTGGDATPGVCSYPFYCPPGSNITKPGSSHCLHTPTGSTFTGWVALDFRCPEGDCNMLDKQYQEVLLKAVNNDSCTGGNCTTAHTQVYYTTDWNDGVPTWEPLFNFQAPYDAAQQSHREAWPTLPDSVDGLLLARWNGTSSNPSPIWSGVGFTHFNEDVLGAGLVRGSSCVTNPAGAVGSGIASASTCAPASFDCPPGTVRDSQNGGQCIVSTAGGPTTFSGWEMVDFRCLKPGGCTLAEAGRAVWVGADHGRDCTWEQCLGCDDHYPFELCGFDPENLTNQQLMCLDGPQACSFPTTRVFATADWNQGVPTWQEVPTPSSFGAGGEAVSRLSLSGAEVSGVLLVRSPDPAGSPRVDWSFVELEVHHVLEGPLQQGPAGTASANVGSGAPPDGHQPGPFDPPGLDGPDISSDPAFINAASQPRAFPPNVNTGAISASRTGEVGPVAYSLSVPPPASLPPLDTSQIQTTTAQVSAEHAINRDALQAFLPAQTAAGATFGAGPLAPLDPSLFPQITGPETDAPANGVPGYRAGEGAPPSLTSDPTDPVSPGSGEFVHRMVDIEVPGIGIPLRLERTYRSRWNYEGPVGFGWTHSYDQRIRRSSDSCGTEELEWHAGDGSIRRFARRSSGAWTSRNAARFRATESPTGLSFSTPEGDVYEFDWVTGSDLGLLRETRDRFGNTVVVNWANLPSSPRVNMVIGSTGSWLAFAYAASGFLETISSNLSDVYAHYVVDSNKDLVEAEGSGGHREQYSYLSGYSSNGKIPRVHALDVCSNHCRLGEGECRQDSPCSLTFDGVGCFTACRSPVAGQDLFDRCSQLAEERCGEACNDEVTTSACLGECLSEVGPECATSAGSACATFAEENEDDLRRRCDKACATSAMEACDQQVFCTHRGYIFPFDSWIDDYCVGVGGCFGYRSTRIHGNYFTGRGGFCGVAGWCCEADCLSCALQGHECPAGSPSDRSPKVLPLPVGTFPPPLTQGCPDWCFTDWRDINCPAATEDACFQLGDVGCRDACGGPTCVAGCTQLAEDEYCANEEYCREQCRDAFASCGNSCVASCFQAHADLGYTYGNSSELNHNLVTVTDGAGRTFVENEYETSAEDANFDAVKRQLFGGAEFVTEMRLLDLDPDHLSDPGPDAALIDAEKQPTSTCGVVCLNPPAGRHRELWVSMGSGEYAVLSPGDSPAPRTVSGDLDMLGVYSWYELYWLGGTDYRLRPEVELGSGFQIETRDGLLFVSDGEQLGQVVLSGLDPNTIRSYFEDAPSGLVLLRRAGEWQAYRGQTLGATRVSPHDACPERFEIEPTAFDQQAGAAISESCTGSFRVDEIARSTPRNDGTYTTWQGAISDARGATEWTGGAEKLYFDRRVPLQGSFISPTETWSGLCPDSPFVTGIPNLDCLSALSLQPHLGLQPELCSDPWFQVRSDIGPPQFGCGFGVGLPGEPVGEALPSPLCEVEQFAPPTAMGGERFKRVAVWTERDGTTSQVRGKWLFWMDDRGLIRTITEALGGSEEHRSYDYDGRLVGMMDRQGVRTCTKYNQAWRPLSVHRLPAAGYAKDAEEIWQEFGWFDNNQLHALKMPMRSGIDPLVIPFRAYYDPAGMLSTVDYELDQRSLQITPQLTGARVDGRIVAIDKGDGGRVAYGYDSGSGQVSEVIDDHLGPYQVTTSLGRDAQGKLTSFGRLGQPLRSWTRSGDHRRLSETTTWDPAVLNTPVTTTFGYDSAKRLTSVLDPRRQLTMTENGQGRLEALGAVGTSAVPRVSCFGYDGRGELVAAIDGEGRQVKFTRNGLGDVTAIERGIGPIGSFGTQCAGNVLDQPGAGFERFVSISYGSDTLPLTRSLGETGAPLVTESYSHDAYGRLIEILNGDGSAQRWGHDAMDRVSWSATFLPGTTRPSSSVPWTEPSPTDPLLASLERYSYDWQGRVTQRSLLHFVDNPSRTFLGGQGGWLTWTWQYFDNIRTVQATTPEGELTETVFDYFGRVTRRTQVSSPSIVTNITYAVDGLQATEVTSPASTPSGNLTRTLKWTPSGALREVRDSTNEVLYSATFDEHARTVRVTDRRGAVEFNHNGFDEVIEQRRVNGVTTEPYLTVSRNRNGVVAAVLDGFGAGETYRFDRVNRIDRTTHAIGGFTTFGYLPGTRTLGALQDRRGDLYTIGHDDFGEVSDVTVQRGSFDPIYGQATDWMSITRSVRGIEQVSRSAASWVTGGAVTLDVVRDSLGRGYREASSIEPAQVLQRTAWRSDGQWSAMTVGSTQWSRSFDELGRLTSLSLGGPVVYDPTYAGAGGPTKLMFADPSVPPSQNKLYTSPQYDEEGRLRKAQARNEAATNPTRFGWEVFYGTNGVIARQDRWLSNDQTPSARRSAFFQSDFAGRLSDARYEVAGLAPSLHVSGAIDASSGGPLSTYTDPAQPNTDRLRYDIADDWLSPVEIRDVSTPVATDFDHRLSVFGASGVWGDAEGRVTYDGRVAYHWDGFGRLEAAIENQGTGTEVAWRFAYDGYGRLVSWSRNGVVDKVIYDGAAVARWVSGATGTYFATDQSGLPVSTLKGTLRRYFHHDPMGRLSHETDAAAGTRSQVAYSGHGAPTFYSGGSQTPVTSNNVTHPFLAQGRPYFETLGAFSMGHRWYRPGMGRFLSPDPLGFIDGPNPFIFGGAQPMYFVDPDGLWMRASELAIVGMLGGALGFSGLPIPGPDFRDDHEAAIEFFRGQIVGAGIGLTSDAALLSAGAPIAGGLGAALGCLGSFCAGSVPAAVGAYSTTAGIAAARVTMHGMSALQGAQGLREAERQYMLSEKKGGGDGAATPASTTNTGVSPASATGGPKAGLDALSASGREVVKNDLTRAGLEYQKHMGRGELPKVSGRELNSAGQSLLDAILRDPQTKQIGVFSGNFPGGTRFIGPNGIGATFDAKGVFRYFGVYP